MKNLILLHGAIGDKSQLSKLKIELEKNYTVHSFNFDGHGSKFSKKEFSIELFTQNLYDYMDDNDLNNVTIFGYSMGGYVALNLALIAPTKINKIITYGTKFEWSPEIALQETKQLNSEIILEKIPKFASYLETVHEVNDWKMVLEKTSKMMLNLGDSPVLNADNLKDLNCPVLIMSGEKDTMVTTKESEKFASYIPNSKSKEIEGFVHPILQNDASVFSSLIREFIES